MANNFVIVGEQFPVFNKKSVVSIEQGKEFKNISNKDMDGRWAVIFWWPKDFSLICPTEIAAFNKNYDHFKDRETVLLGASTDSEYAHLAWRKIHNDLHDLKFPMIADTSKSLAESLGILSADEKVAFRVTYIIDPEGTVNWISMNTLNVGRNVEEVLRVLDALQTGALCPCNWKKGDEVLSPGIG